jgi:hypothetical protein
MRDLALPPGCRVVALREVDVMPHPRLPGPAAAILVAGHPGDLPARRGHGPSGLQDRAIVAATPVQHGYVALRATAGTTCAVSVGSQVHSQVGSVRFTTADHIQIT